MDEVSGGLLALVCVALALGANYPRLGFAALWGIVVVEAARRLLGGA